MGNRRNFWLRNSHEYKRKPKGDRVQGAGCMLRWRLRGNRGHPNSVSRATKGRPKNNIKIWRLREESGVEGLKWKKEIWREETPRGKMPDTFMRKLKFIPAFSPESISNSERVGNYYFPHFFLLFSFSNQSSLSPSPHLFVADSRARHIHTAHSTACTSTKFLYINPPPPLASQPPFTRSNRRIHDAELSDETSASLCYGYTVSKVAPKRVQ